MDAHGPSGSSNSRCVFVSPERPLSGSIAAGGSSWRFRDECISFPRGVFERRLSRIWSGGIAASSVERIDEPVGCCEPATRSGNPHALGASPRQKGARERTSFLPVGPTDALSESRRSAFVAAAAFVPRVVRSGRGARRWVCARGETICLSGAFGRGGSEGFGPFGGRRGKRSRPLCAHSRGSRERLSWSCPKRR